ncbi:hypothetical protein AAVH_24284 [Aphelenchoides avenae]|nr:hypothetical protein AAVH_24284 [Aphelenchus avenae]
MKTQQERDLAGLASTPIDPQTGEKAKYEDLETAIFLNSGLLNINYFHRCRVQCGTDDDPNRIEGIVYPTMYGTFSIAVPSRKGSLFTRAYFAKWCQDVIGKAVVKDSRVRVGGVPTLEVVAAEDASSINKQACAMYKMYAPYDKDQAGPGAPITRNLHVKAGSVPVQNL